MTESCPLPSGGDCIDNAVDWKGFVEELRRQWKLLWRERIDDKIRAEGIADKDFELLFVDRGTVIVATRCYRQLDFKEILKEYEAPYEVRVKQEQPPQSVGGWRKFAKKEIISKGKRERPKIPKKKAKEQQMRKGGRGWLHFRM